MAASVADPLAIYITAANPEIQNSQHLLFHPSLLGSGEI